MTTNNSQVREVIWTKPKSSLFPHCKIFE